MIDFFLISIVLYKGLTAAVSIALGLSCSFQKDRSVIVNMMKIAILLFAVASVVFSKPTDEYWTKGTKRNTVRLVCENGLCMLKPVEWSTSQKTPIEDEEPSMTMGPSEGDQKEDDGIDQVPENPPEMESTESTDVKIVEGEHDDQTSNGDDIQIVKMNGESMENSGAEETVSDSDHHSVEEHQDDMIKYMSMIADNLPKESEHEASSEEKEDEPETHTLSTELEPPHEKNYWIPPPIENVSSEEDSSVIYKIPSDTKPNIKGLKGIKTYKL